MNHGPAQEPYLSHKAEILHAYLKTHPKWSVNNGFGTWTARFHTVQSAAFKSLLKVMLQEAPGKRNLQKKVTPEWAAQLTHQSLAYWYMDDGTLQSKQVKFMTHSFSLEECEILAQRLREMGYEGTKTQPVKKNNNRTYHLVVIPTEGSKKFLKDTEEFAHESMRYKWEPPTSYHVCDYCSEEFESSAKLKPRQGRRKCCAKASCRKLFVRDQSADHEICRKNRSEKTNAKLRERRSAMDPAERKAADKENRSKMNRDRFNATRRRWRAKLKSEGKTHRNLQKHTCQFCQQKFSNTATHKMSKRSPVIYCTQSECLTLGKEFHKDLQRARARKKYKEERMAISNP